MTLLVSRAYWIPILLCAAFLALHAADPFRRRPCLSPALITAVTLLYTLLSPHSPASVEYFSAALPAVCFVCALDRLTANWKNASGALRLGLIAPAAVSIVCAAVQEIRYRSGTPIAFLLFLELTGIFVLPRRKNVHPFALWAAQVAVVLILTLPGLAHFGFRVSYYLNYETALPFAIRSMPVLFCLPALCAELWKKHRAAGQQL